MGLAAIPEKTDESIGRVKVDAATVAPTLAAIVELLNTADLDTKVPAEEFERIKDAVIDVSEAVGLGDGSTSGSLEERLQEIEGVLTVTGTDTLLVAEDDLTLQCVDTLGLIAFDGVTAVSLALDPQTGIQGSVAGINNFGLTAITLKVPPGFNATNPGIAPNGYMTDGIGLDWFGTQGVDSRLRIAGRLLCYTGDVHVKPAGDATGDFGSLTERFRNVWAQRFEIATSVQDTGGGDGEGGVARLETANASTGDNTPTTVETFTLEQDAAYMIEARVLIHDAEAPESGVIVSVATMRNVGGTATLDATATPVSSITGLGAVSVAWNASGDDVTFDVTGTANDINWTVLFTIMKGASF